MQGVIVRETSIGASAVVDNLYSGSNFTFLSSPSIIVVAIVGSATGLVAALQIGARILVEESPLMVLGTMPIIPDHFFFSGIGLQTEQIILRVRNTTAGALTARSICQLTDA
jgi:hypothetical protein